MLALLLTSPAASWGGRAAQEGEYSAQIVGGGADRQPDVRWVIAVLERRSGSRFQRQFCGGSLVSPRYVLTAAHCVEDGDRDDPAELQILSGTKNLNHGGVVRNVTDIHVFPGFRPRTNYGDMALLQLARPVGHRPVALVSAGTRYIGRQGYVAGWGSNTGGNSFPKRLRSAFIPIRPDSVCRNRSYARPYAAAVMICAGDGHPDTCRGDSGGPLARRVRGNWRLVGVTSYGHPSCQGPGVYAWVGSARLRSWLRGRLGH